jgi:hypothetical protein
MRKTMLLQETIKAIAAGKAHNRSELAQQLGVSEDMLAQLMRELEFKGYLKSPAADAGSTSQCRGCSCAHVCSGDETRKMWQLTEKGLRAAGRAATGE